MNVTKFSFSYGNIIPTLFPIKNLEDQLGNIFSEKFFKDRYTSNSFTKEYVKNYIEEYGKSVKKIKLESPEDLSLIIFVLLKGRWKMEISPFGLLKIKFNVEIPEAFLSDANILEETKIELTNHFNHMYQKLRERIHKHQYFVVRWGFPYCKPNEVDEITLVGGVLDSMSLKANKLTNTCMKLIDQHEYDWRNKLESFWYVRHFPRIYYKSDELVANIRKREWALEHLKRSIMLLRNKHGIRTENDEKTFSNLGKLLSIRREVSSNVRDNIVHGTGFSAFCLSVVGILLAFPLSITIGIKIQFVIYSLMFVFLFLLFIFIGGIKSSSLKHLKIEIEGE